MNADLQAQESCTIDITGNIIHLHLITLQKPAAADTLPIAEIQQQMILPLQDVPAATLLGYSLPYSQSLQKSPHALH